MVLRKNLEVLNMSRKKNYKTYAKTSLTARLVEARKVHAIRRAKERYGVDLEKADLDSIVELIWCNKSHMKERLSTRFSKHELEYKKELFLVVYDRELGVIKTFLPYFKHRPFKYLLSGDEGNVHQNLHT